MTTNYDAHRVTKIGVLLRISGGVDFGWMRYFWHMSCANGRSFSVNLRVN